MKRIPFIIAIIIAALLAALVIYPAFATPSVRPSQADATYWYALDGGEKTAYLTGYITASWVWATGIFEAQSFGDLTDQTAHVYRMLAPAAAMTWPELELVINAHYANGGDQPLWKIIASHQPLFDTEPTKEGLQ